MGEYNECGCGDYEEQDDQLLFEGIEENPLYLRGNLIGKIVEILLRLESYKLIELAAELEERYKEKTAEEEVPVSDEFSSDDTDDAPF